MFKPEMEIVLFAAQDIVTASGDNGDNGTQLPGGGAFPEDE